MNKKELFIDAIRKASKEQLTEQEVRTFEAIYDGFEKSQEGDKEARKAEFVSVITEKLSTTEETVRSLVNKLDEIESRSSIKLGVNEKTLLRKKVTELLGDGKVRKAYNENKTIHIEFDSKRAAALMTVGNTLTTDPIPANQNVEVDSEISMFRYPANFIMDMIRSMQVSKVPNSILKKEQSGLEGDAALTAEGAVKPLISFSFTQKVYTRKKYAGHIEVTEEMTIDNDLLYTEIISLFEDVVIRKWQDGVLADILASYSVPYVSTGMDGQMVNPDQTTAILAAKLQIMDNNFEPDQIWINPADAMIMKAQKNSTGDYVVNPFFMNDNNFAGLVLRTSNKIDAGKFLVGTSSTIKEKHSSFIMRAGLINEQLIENESTVVGEVFSIVYQSVVDKPSWVYGEYAPIIEALAVV